MKTMKTNAITAFFALGCCIALAGTNQVITVDAKHNNAGADAPNSLTYRLTACESFTIDASEFKFTKPVETLFVALSTGQVATAHLVTNITSSSTMRFSIDAKHLVTSNGLKPVTFGSGTVIRIAFCYKRPDDPDPLGVRLGHAPIEWLGRITVE